MTETNESLAFPVVVIGAGGTGLCAALAVRAPSYTC